MLLLGLERSEMRQRKEGQSLVKETTERVNCFIF